VTVYQVEPSRSLVCATIYSSLHSIERSGPISGEVDVTDGSAAEAIPVAGQLLLDLTTMVSSDRLYDRELETRLDIHRYPRVTARLTEVVPDGAAGCFRMAGELSFHGRTNEVHGTATVQVSADEVHLSGAMTLDVREFGIDPPKILLLKVKPVVDVALDLLAYRMS
jgi:polyisoprenoid-binding protein YceI